MNLREAIGEYAVHYGLRQEVLGWEGEGVERIHRQFGEVVERLCRIVEVAEAAIAYMEHQATSVHDPDECDLDRAQQRATLWDAFMEARARAKAINQQ